jgi:putative ABC transport system permease protein
MGGRRRGRLFSWLVGLFPAEFRGDFGEDMTTDFQDQRADAAARGRGSLARLWTRTLLDMTRRAPLEHLEILRRDVGYALRLLRRRPAFAGAVVVTLAIGIGANTAVFSVVSGVLLRGLPLANGDRVVRLMSVESTKPDEFNDVSSYAFLDWQTQSKTLDRMALSSVIPGKLLVPGGDPESAGGMVVTEGFFDIVGVTPALGRTFTADEYRDGQRVLTEDDRPGVALLSDGLWRRKFGARPDVVGTQFRVDARVLTVVGVMPAEIDLRGVFRFSPQQSPPYWLPGRPNTGPMSLRRSSREAGAIGRIAPGVSLAEAQAEFDRISASLGAIHPEDVGWSVRLIRPLDTLVSGVRRQVWLLALAAFCVLVIAAANVTNLMLAHASGRRLEMASRVAIGATRAHLVRQLLTEGLVLSALGGALGVAFAYWAVPALVALAPATVPRLDEIVVDRRVLMFALLTSVAIGAGCGCAAAIAPVRRYAEAAVRSGRLDARGHGRRVRQGLTIAQVALALILVAAAGLLVRTVRALDAQALGFDPQNVLGATINMGESMGRRKTLAFIEQVTHLPGVIDAGMGPRPLARTYGGRTVSRSADAVGERTEVNQVTAGFFRVLRSRLIRGRLFEERDQAATDPIAIVSESAARHFWPGLDPIGRQLFINGDRSVTVVGAIADIRRNGLVGEPVPVVYPLASQGSRFSGGTLWIRTQGDPRTLVPAFRAVLKGLDPEAPLDVRTLEDAMAAEMAPHRFMFRLVGLFSALALVLAMLGTYGVLAESVAQRVPEIGVRVALGATRSAIAALVLSQGGWMVGLGVAIGTTAAYLMRHLMSGYVFGVPTSDALTYATSAIAVALAALGASCLPARRAAAVDPVVALRQE